MRPEPASVRRQLSYQEDTPLDLPDDDPGGWKTLSPGVFHGTIFTIREISIQCILSLATPLSYTRGTVIPLFLVLTSEDKQALDLLSSDNAIHVLLCRHIRYHMLASHASKNKQVNSGWKDTSEFLDGAVWWPVEGESRDGNTRKMHGEIRLSKDLMPSTSIAHFSVDVSKILRSACFFSLLNFDSSILSF
jgi:hypothetical protein